MFVIYGEDIIIIIKVLNKIKMEKLNENIERECLTAVCFTFN